MTKIEDLDGCTDTTVIDIPTDIDGAEEYVGCNKEAELYELLNDLLKEEKPHPRALLAQERLNEFDAWFDSKFG